MCFLAGQRFTFFPNHEYFILEQTVQAVFAAKPTHMLFGGLHFASLACSLLNDSGLLSIPIASSWEICNYRVFSLASFFFAPLTFSNSIESSWRRGPARFSQAQAQLYEGERRAAAAAAASYCATQLCLSLPGHGAFSGSDSTQIR